MAAADDPRTTSIDDVPEDVLEAILLRVSSPVCLARAAAACKLWRHVVAGARFASRYRSLHVPAAAGCYFNSYRSFLTMVKPCASIRPSFDTSSSAAAAGVDVDPRHFSLDFLSDDEIAGLHSATVLDSRGGLLLIEFKGLYYIPRAFPDVLVVCEPLTQRYEKISPPLDFDDQSCTYWRSYLVDGDGNEAAAGGRTISMSNFRVLCEMYRGGVACAAVFTAGSGGAGSSWSERAIAHVVPRLDHTRHILGRAGSSWYYFNIREMTWIVLDGSTGEYSSSNLPTTADWDLHNWRWKYKFYVTEGCNGEPRIFSLLDGTVKVFARLGGAGGGWALERSVSLRYNENWHMYLWAKGPGFIIVALEYTLARQFLSIDLETMEVKLAAEEKRGILYPCTLPCPPYAPA